MLQHEKCHCGSPFGPMNCDGCEWKKCDNKCQHEDFEFMYLYEYLKTLPKSFYCQKEQACSSCQECKCNGCCKPIRKNCPC